MAKQDIPITMGWNTTGWENFSTGQDETNGIMLGDSGNLTYPIGLAGQNHIDVRNFIEGTWTGGLTTGYVSAVNHWPGGRITIAAGNYTFTSNYTNPIDLTALGSNTVLSLTLPSLPLSSINTAQSFVDLSSDGFVTTCSLRWSASTTTPTNGNSVLQWPYASLTGTDFTKITNVRIRVTATGSGTLTLMALRLLDTRWLQTSVDFDNLSQQLRQCIPLTGDTALVPVAGNAVVPTLYRAADPTGDDDPRIINSEIGFLFNTGSNSKTNIITVTKRQVTGTSTLQTGLQGVTQSMLQGLPQPGLTGTDDSWISYTLQWGTAPSVTITDSLHPTTGYQFSGLTLAANTTYFCTCQLVKNNARLQILPVDQTTYSFHGSTLLPSNTLYPSTSLDPLDDSQTIYPIFDTKVIPDPFRFTRRAGRLGFQAVLNDGDAYVLPVRPRQLTYAEFRSRPLKSLTPVNGARLYVQTSPDETELWSEWEAVADSNSVTPIIATDQQRFLGTHPDKTSTRVTITTPSTVTPSQALYSNTLTPDGDPVSGVTDFDQLHIDFSLWVPSSAVAAGGHDSLPLFTAALVSDRGASYPINIPTITPDQWTTFSIFRPVSRPYPISGLYQFALYYNGTIGTTFWVDAVSVHQHSIEWSGRSVADTPWYDTNAPWTTFHDKLNSDTDGALFTNVGSQLQLRGRAFKQNVSVTTAPKYVPRYAELGRLTWPEDAPPPVALPTPVITVTQAARNYTFSGLLSTSPVGIANYFWEFGDGSFASGVTASHTYSPTIPTGTQYQATLFVTDKRGQVNSVSSLVILP